MREHVLCTAILRSGDPCRFPAKPGGGELLCGRHQPKYTCAICLREITRAPRILSKCSHAFHACCIRAWFSKGVLTCPTCRAPCVAELHGLRGHVAHKLNLLLKTLPPPPGIHLQVYLMGLLTCPSTQRALDVDDDSVQRLLDVAETEDTIPSFLRTVRSLTF